MEHTLSLLLLLSLARNLLVSESATGEGDAPEMQPERSEGAATWEDRLRQEHDELEKKLDNLEKFILTPVFENLSQYVRSLLSSQRYPMGDYLRILKKRIAEL